jgi:hypothetical protein
VSDVSRPERNGERNERLTPSQGSGDNPLAFLSFLPLHSCPMIGPRRKHKQSQMPQQNTQVPPTPQHTACVNQTPGDMAVANAPRTGDSASWRSHVRLGTGHDQEEQTSSKSNKSRCCNLCPERAVPIPIPVYRGLLVR